MARFGKSPEGEKLVKHFAKQIKSLGTRRAYAQCLNQFAAYARENGYRESLQKAPEKIVYAYLHDRAEIYNQKTLDQHRQSIQAITKTTYAVIKAEAPQGRLATESRAYTPEQILEVIKFQSPEMGFSTQLAEAAGLRAHELHTLRTAEERTATGERDWSDKRFQGREGPRYTVQGKGGLIREVCIPHPLAEKLETYRLDAPRDITDRQIDYPILYDIKGGQNWSQSFTQASERSLCWSTGAHGLRHSYAQERMDELRKIGLTRFERLQIISQEMGHFRPDITEVYLR